MFKKLTLAASLILYAGIFMAAGPSDDRIVRSISTVADLAAHDWVSWPHIMLSGYISAGDGGEGPLDKVDCTGKTIDQGYVFTDASENCFQRSSINGSARQYGVVENSIYDCKNGKLSTCVDAIPRINAMFTAEQPLGITHFTTDGMNILFGQDFNLPDNLCMTTGLSTIGQSTPLIDPGVIWTADHIENSMGDDACWDHFEFVPKWTGLAPYNGTPGIELYYQTRQNMADMGDTGLHCNNGQCSITYGRIEGYDNPINVEGPGSNVCNMRIDGNIGLWLHATGSNTKWCYITVTGDLTNGPEGDKYYNITNVQDDGSADHLCKITVNEITDGFAQDGLLSELFDGAYIWISNLDDTTGAQHVWNRWQLHLVSSGVFTLNGSKCLLSGGKLNNNSFTANIIAGSNRLEGVTDFTNVNENEYVTNANLPTGTKVDFVWQTQGYVYLTYPTGQTATGSATGATIATASDIFTPAADQCSAKTSSSGRHPCAILSSVARFFSGNSAAGVAANHRGVAFLIGGADPDTNKVSGFDLEHVFIYGFDIPLREQNVEHTTLYDFKTDSVRKIEDDATGCAWIDGNYKDIFFNNSGCGKAGFGLLIGSGGDGYDDIGDDESPGKGVVTLTGFHGGSYEFDGGIIQGTNLKGSARFVLIGDVNQIKLSGTIDAQVVYKSPASYGVSNLDLASSGLVQYNNIWAPNGAPLPADHISAGTGASVSGNNFFGEITAGTGSPTSITWTMVGGNSDGGENAPNNWNCVFQNTSAPTTMLKVVTRSHQSVTVNSYTAAGAAVGIANGAVITYQCGTWGAY